MLSAEVGYSLRVVNSEIRTILPHIIRKNSIIVLSFIQYFSKFLQAILSLKLWCLSRHSFKIQTGGFLLADTLLKSRLHPSINMFCVFLSFFRSILVRNLAISFERHFFQFTIAQDAWSPSIHLVSKTNIILASFKYGKRRGIRANQKRPYASILNKY